jgi:hypothetical protein
MIVFFSSIKISINPVRLMMILLCKITRQQKGKHLIGGIILMRKNTQIEDKKKRNKKKKLLSYSLGYETPTDHKKKGK